MGSSDPQQEGTARKKGITDLVAEARSEIELYSPTEAIERIGDDDVVFVDVREL